MIAEFRMVCGKRVLRVDCDVGVVADCVGVSKIDSIHTQNKSDRPRE